MIDKLETIEDLKALVEQRNQALNFIQIADKVILNFLLEKNMAEFIKPQIDMKGLKDL